MLRKSIRKALAGLGGAAREGGAVRVKVAAFKLDHPDCALLDTISFLR